MTEAEARQRWCPFAASRVVTRQKPDGKLSIVCAAGPTTKDEPETLCISSACMAWRWTDIIEAQGQSVPMPQGNPHGYCGLAGKP